MFILRGVFPLPPSLDGGNRHSHFLHLKMVAMETVSITREINFPTTLGIGKTQTRRHDG